MGETEGKGAGLGARKIKRYGSQKSFDPSFFVKPFDPSFFVKLQNQLRDCVKSQLSKIAKRNKANSVRKGKGSSSALGVDLESQLQAWRENPHWVDQPPEIKVSVPKGSLCNLNVNFDVGFPPDAIYDIVIDPDNRRVFKNIKEVLSRRVLFDDGLRQVVDVEQAAIWKFLWWSGTISVHVLVDQNRQDHSMKFKQLKTGFMKKFEGCWTVEPVFVDEKMCYPFRPKTWEEYCSCTGGKGRIGSRVSLDQLIQPSIVPPPPISWYLRGITSKTTEMIATDLLAEAARIRGDFAAAESRDSETLKDLNMNSLNEKSIDIKERWAQHRRNAKKHQRKLLSAA